MIFDIDKFDFSNPDNLPFLAVYYFFDDGSETFFHVFSPIVIHNVEDGRLVILLDMSDEVASCTVKYSIPVDHISLLMWVDYNDDFDEVIL